MRFAGAIAALLAAPAYAQAPHPASQIRKNFDDCVYNSAAIQLKDPRNRDISMIAEQGFAACETEERAMLAYLQTSTIPPQQINAMLVGIRLQIKNTLRDIAANPAKYAK